MQEHIMAKLIMLMVVVWVGLMCGLVVQAAQVSVSVVHVEFVNELSHQFVRVTLTAPPLGTAPSTVVPPGESRTLPMEVLGPAANGICFQVGSQFYLSGGTPQPVARVLGETGTLKVFITGNCAFKQPGLQHVSTAADNTPTAFVCTPPVKSC